MEVLQAAGFLSDDWGLNANSNFILVFHLFYFYASIG